MEITALVLRVIPGQGRNVVLQCFSEQYGRIALCCASQKGAFFSAFSLIETMEYSRNGDFCLCRDSTTLNTFSGESRSLYIIRAILEKCLPMMAISTREWELVLSLLDSLSLFSDWKAAPLLLTLHFFENEGVSPKMLTEIPSFSEEIRRNVQQLIESDVEFWKNATIPEEVLYAGLECIGITRSAKGGT